MLTSQGRSDIGARKREGIPPVRRYEWLGKSNEDQWGGLGRLNIFPLRRQVMDRTEEIGGRGAKEEAPPECSDGETERNFRIADKPKVPRLSKQELIY